jgi:hypothetical protein
VSPNKLGLTKKVFQGFFIRTPIGEQIQIFDSQRRMSDFLVSPGPKTEKAVNKPVRNNFFMTV